MHRARFLKCTENVQAYLIGKFVLCAIVSASVINVANAQNSEGVTSFEMTSRDENNVDHVSGFSSFSAPGVSIGNGQSVLEHSISSMPNGFNAGWGLSQPYFGGWRQARTTDIGPQCYPAKIVEVGAGANFFCGDDTAGYQEYRQEGSTLIKINSTQYEYTNKSGTVYLLDSTPSRARGGWGGRLLAITHPDGQVIEIHYDSVDRVQAVTHNAGLQLRYEYTDAVYPNFLTKVTAVNTAIDYCNPDAASCSYSKPWRSVSYQWQDISSAEKRLTVTHPGGEQTRFTMDAGRRVSKVKPANASVDTIEYFYCEPKFGEPAASVCAINQGDNTPAAGTWSGGADPHDKVYLVKRNGKSWYYGFSTFSPTCCLTIQTYTSTSDVGRGKVVESAFSDNGNQWIGTISVDNKVYSFNGIVTNRLVGVTQTDDFDVSFEYDARGNRTRQRKYKTGMTDVNTYAGFDTTCANPKQCNKPNWTKDGKGNQTDYVYETTGLTKSVTLPAATAGGERPQTRYFYGQKYAYVKNSTGGYVAAASPIWLLTKESTCKTGAPSGNGCAIAGDEVVTTYDYGPASGPNNLFLRGTVVTADGQSLRTCYSYDIYGNKISETSPRAGLTSCP